MWQQIAGGIISAMGAVHKAQADSRRKDQLNQLSELPGVDVNDATAEALAGREANFDQAAGIARKQNQFDQVELDKILEASIPGYKAMQASRIGNATSFLRGDIPDDVRSQVYRRGNAQAVGGGYGGSEAARNLVARDLGLTSLDLMDRGQRYSSSIIGTTPHITLSTTKQLSGVDPSDVLGLRSKERSEKIGLKLRYIGQPGATDAHAEFDTQLGGALLGGGMGGMGGGAPKGGGGGNGMSSFQGSGSTPSGMAWG